MEKAKSFEVILTNLNILRYIIQSKVKLGLYDVNKRSENFFKGLLNEIYGWKLENLNAESNTYPGIDLGSSLDKVSIQVTSQRTPDKIQHTIDLFDKHEYHKTYNRVIAFIITSKPDFPRSTFSSSTITFDKAKDIVDIDDLLGYIENNFDAPQTKAVEKYIVAEIPYYINAITDSSDLLHTLADYKQTKSTNLNKVISYLATFGDKNYISEFAVINNDTFDRLNTLSQKDRTGLIPILTKGKASMDLQINTWGSVLENSFDLSRQEIRSIGIALERTGLLYNNDDDEAPSFVLFNKEYWLNVVELLSPDEVFDFVVNMNFSLLDS